MAEPTLRNPADVAEIERLRTFAHAVRLHALRFGSVPAWRVNVLGEEYGLIDERGQMKAVEESR